MKDRIDRSSLLVDEPVMIQNTDKLWTNRENRLGEQETKINEILVTVDSNMRRMHG